LIDEAGVGAVRSHPWVPNFRGYHWEASVDHGSITRVGTVRSGPSSAARPVDIRARPGTSSCIRR
jgi:hypothetical protein